MTLTSLSLRRVLLALCLAAPLACIFPLVLFAHGHWRNARLSDEPAEKVRVQIATGEERFEQAGRSRFQAMCVQLARMGCVVWQWEIGRAHV